MVFVKLFLNKSYIIKLQKNSTIQSGTNLIFCQEVIINISVRNKLLDTLITSITLVVGFHGEAISSGDELENFSASSFVLKHLNLAPENFFTVCNANFLSVKTKV